jgi:signal transduction histidine kinase
MASLSRKTVSIVLWGFIVFLSIYSLYLPFAYPGSLLQIVCPIMLGVTVVGLIAFRRGHQWPRYMIVVIISALIGLLNPEPYVTERLTITIFVGPMLALVLADAPWVIVSASISYLLLLSRAGWSGIYLEPVSLGVTVLLIFGMALSRQLTDAALARAEEQASEIEHARANLAQRVAERTRELSAANAELRQANQMKDSFLASISHELRTPLNVILGSVELLLEQIYGPLVERQRSALRTVSESGHHLLNLINDILDLAKMESGKFDFEISNVPIIELCEQCIRLTQVSALRRSIAVSLEIDRSLGLVRSDPRRLRQILLNLLNNAVKFTPNGGAAGLIVSVAGESDAPEIVLEVWDTGIGIAAADQALLFRPFTQIDNSLSRQYEGSGLGLALVSQLVSYHRGSISVDSAPGKGSRFTVRLPMGSSIARSVA